jgi:hypothetical protein
MRERNKIRKEEAERIRDARAFAAAQINQSRLNPIRLEFLLRHGDPETTLRSLTYSEREAVIRLARYGLLRLFASGQVLDQH